jgi:hypothetical protein
LAWQRIGNLNFWEFGAEEVLGHYAIWDRSGKSFFTRRFEDGLVKIGVYRFGPGGLKQLGSDLLGIWAGWSSNGQALWIKRSENEGLHQIRLYQLGATGLNQLGVDDLGFVADWSSEGQVLWVKKFRNGEDEIWLYQLGDDGLRRLHSSVKGVRVGWGPDGKALWIERSEAVAAAREAMEASGRCANCVML